MNQWSQEQQQFNNMMPNMTIPAPGMGLSAPPPLLPHGQPASMVPPLAPPPMLLNEWDQINVDMNNFIGPTKPEDNANGDSKKDTRDSKRERDTGDRSDRNRRARSPYNRSRSDRSRSERRERRPRWSDNTDAKQDNPTGLGGNISSNNMMMSGNNMMQYGNIMSQQTMDMGNGMQQMGTVPMMSGMNMMPNMMMQGNMMSNIMPNMMMPNVMDHMMQQQYSHQPIYVTGAVLLPPLPNVQLPARRERPPGCRTIFVGGLPMNGVTESVAAEIFQRFGAISDIKMHNNGVCHVRFEKQETVEQAFYVAGFRFKRLDQSDNEATALFVDYALNRDDQSEQERRSRRRSPTPIRHEPYSSSAMAMIMEKIKSDTEFIEAAPTLFNWLERGECNKKNANTFYSAIQAANGQIRRLYNEKMTLDEELQNAKALIKDKFCAVIMQFEQVGKILTAAKVQRVSDHFSKQQRRNIEMWLKMTEDVENIKEEFNATFDEDDGEEKPGKGVPLKKYEELKSENEKLQYELEGYKNEAFLAKDEAERKFEKFKAHYIAQQALQNSQPGTQLFPPLPPPSVLKLEPVTPKLPQTRAPVPHSEAKFISILTSFLLVHPLGASLDYLVSYVRSIIPNTSQGDVHNILQKYPDVFANVTTGVGANIDNKWKFITFDLIKKESK